MFFRERRTDQGRPESYPLLPLREVVVFPHQPMSLIVGRARSLAAVTAANERDREVFLVAQRDGNVAEPSRDEVYAFGTIARIESGWPPDELATG